MTEFQARPDLSVIIVSYNVAPFLVQTLESVYKASRELVVEVFVVDNASKDDSVALVREKFPDVSLIANSENLGFSKANNQAIRLAKAPYILLLNPDVIVGEDTFVTCLDEMQAHADIGGLGVYMIDGSGRYLPESKRGLPTPWVAFCKVVGLTALFPRNPDLARYYLGHLDENETHEIDVLSGAFMLMRREALDKSGLLDESFFMYGEDVDLSYRLKQAGYKNKMLAKTTILHYKGESTKRGSINYVRVFYKAMYIFARKHFGKSYAKFLGFFIEAAIYGRASLSLFARLTKSWSAPVIDFIVIYAGMYFLKEYWETFHKGVPDYYPSDFVTLVVPAYIAVWLGAVWGGGGYIKPYRPSVITRGLIVGTVLIAAATNFFDNYRFSKALILLGGTWSIFSLLGWRMLWHFFKYRNWELGELPSKRILVVGHGKELIRAYDILERAGQRSQLIGYLDPEPIYDFETVSLLQRLNLRHLGQFSQLEKAIELYGVSELVFCLRDIANQDVLQWMRKASGRGIVFRTLPEMADVIIGSRSKGDNGDWYSLEPPLAYDMPEMKRQKRVLDVIMCLVLLIMSPALVWLMKKPGRFLGNCCKVLFGYYQWVGLSRGKSALQHQHRPEKRDSILTPADGYLPGGLSSIEVENLLYLYRKDYRPSLDLRLVIKNFNQLGR